MRLLNTLTILLWRKTLFGLDICLHSFRRLIHVRLEWNWSRIQNIDSIFLSSWQSIRKEEETVIDNERIWNVYVWMKLVFSFLPIQHRQRQLYGVDAKLSLSLTNLNLNLHFCAKHVSLSSYVIFLDPDNRSKYLLVSWQTSEDN